MKADIKTKLTKLSVAAFIDGIADPARRADAKAVVKLMQSATGEKPKMWGPSIIGFGSYHYTYDSGREGDMPIAGFSPRKAATVFYLTRDFSGAETLLAGLGNRFQGGGRVGAHQPQHAVQFAIVGMDALAAKGLEVLKDALDAQDARVLSLNMHGVGAKIDPHTE